MKSSLESYINFLRVFAKYLRVLEELKTYTQCDFISYMNRVFPQKYFNKIHSEIRSSRYVKGCSLRRRLRNEGTPSELDSYTVTGKVK